MIGEPPEKTEWQINKQLAVLFLTHCPSYWLTVYSNSNGRKKKQWCLFQQTGGRTKQHGLFCGTAIPVSCNSRLFILSPDCFVEQRRMFHVMANCLFCHQTVLSNSDGCSM